MQINSLIKTGVNMYSLNDVTSMFKNAIIQVGTLLKYKKVGGLHFMRVYRFGFNFYISKKVA